MHDAKYSKCEKLYWLQVPYVAMLKKSETDVMASSLAHATSLHQVKSVCSFLCNPSDRPKNGSGNLTSLVEGNIGLY